MTTELLVILMLSVGGMFIVATAVAYLYYVRIWFRAYTVGSPVSFMRLFSLTARRISPYKLISAFARAREEGVDLSLDELEAEQAAGVDPRRIVQCLIDAKKQDRPMTVHEASERIGRSGTATRTTINQEG